ncbi:MAG TPA: thiamine phosphate synthase [Kineosporiaceae bacterium]|nr:thiamine phosphate synthase [Kineosporiaceae bacterium]
MNRQLPDLSLYLVTDTALCGEFGVAATVSAAVAAGATVVQLRDPQAGDAELVRLGRELVERLRGTGVPLLVNDRVDLAGPIGADGAHVGQGDLDPVQARRLLGPGALLGLSVQTVGHVEAALALPAGTLDYLGAGPVWPQDTKPDAAAPGGIDVFTAIVSASPWPCVAIGGVSADRAASIRRAGAAGIAVVSAICGQPDVTAATRTLRRAWDGAGARPGSPGPAGVPDAVPAAAGARR